MIYIFIFIVTIFCTYVAQKSVRNKAIFLFFSMLAIVVPSLFAGFRDTGVGTDTITYAQYIFDTMWHSHYSFPEFLKHYKDDDFWHIEFLYLLLNYIVSLFSNDVHWFYFIANLIVVSFFYLAAYDNRKRASMWLIMAFFSFLFYNASYNIMRQSIAVAMTLYSFKYIEENRWMRSIIWLVIIYLAHSSGVFYAMLLIIHRICYLSNRKIAFSLQVSLAFFISLFFVFFNNVLTLLTLVSDQFVKYDSLYSTGNEKSNVSKFILILYIFFLGLLFSIKKREGDQQQKRDIGFYIYNRLIGIIFFLTSLISITAARISWYLNVLDCIFIPRVLHQVSLKSKRKARSLTILVVFMLVLAWFWTIIINNWHETYPYKSRLLGIY